MQGDFLGHESDIDKKRNKVVKIFIFLVLINLSLFLIKIVPTLFYDSLSLRSDALNSLADFVYSGLILGTSYFAFKPNDRSHPYGHGRYRAILSLVIAASIFLTAFFIIWEGAMGIIGEQRWTFTPFFIIALVVSIITKSGMAVYLKKRGREEGSDIITSAAKDSEADVLASFSALIGVMGAWYGYIMLDLIFGLTVSIWIFKTGYEIASKNIKYLTGAGPDESIWRTIKDTIELEEAVEMTRCVPHYVGPGLHVYCEIKPTRDLDMGLEELHNMEEQIKSRVESLDEVHVAYIHIEPPDLRNRKT